MHDPIADMFIRIKNAQAVGKDSVSVPASTIKENIAKVLQSKGYISGVSRKNATVGEILEITLRYNNKKPAISHLKRISKPGLRRYNRVDKLPRPLSGHGLVIVSTTQGVKSGDQAESLGLGGEVIATVW